MKHAAVSAAALCGLLLTQCRHADPTPPAPVDPLSLLPSATTSGERTFGCLVNGRAYSTTRPGAVNGDWQNPTTIFIGASNRENRDPDGNQLPISLFIRGNLATGQSFVLVPFNKPVNTAANEIVANANVFVTNCHYSGNYFLSGGQVRLSRFDGVQRIAAGTFAFTLTEPGGCDTLRVTQGRFDIQF